ncbi:hypothetical protein CF319_g6373 [Tilletia indica]|nr:hypothetical protein CF319_g6373 [Tilletia indica]
MDKVGGSSPVGSHMCAGWTADFLDLSSSAFINVAVCGLASFSTSSSSKRGRWTTFHTAAAAAKTDQRRAPSQPATSSNKGGMEHHSVPSSDSVTIVSNLKAVRVHSTRSVWDSLVNSITGGLAPHEDVIIPRVLWNYFPSIVGRRPGQTAQRIPRDEFSAMWDNVTHSASGTSGSSTSNQASASNEGADTRRFSATPAFAPAAPTAPAPPTLSAADAIAGSRPRNAFAKTHAAVQEPTHAARQETSEASQASKKDFKLHGGVVTFLPERLLDQHLDLNTTKMLKYLSTKKYQVRIDLPPSLETGASIMKEIKSAFKQQIKSLDLFNVDVEFAYYMNLKTKWLTALPVSLDQINRRQFEKYYAHAPCIIVPAVNPKELDPDFHQFKRDEEDNVKTSKGKKRQITVIQDDEFADADLDLWDHDNSHAAAAARPKPKPMISTARRKLRRRCRSCFEKLPVDSDCDEDEVDCAQKAHWAVCKRPDREEVQWVTDTDNPDGSPIPDVTDDGFDRNVAGVPEDFKDKLIKKLRKYRETIRLDLEPDDDDDHLPNAASSSAIKPEASEEAVACSCGKPDWTDNASISLKPVLVPMLAKC